MNDIEAADLGDVLVSAGGADAGDSRCTICENPISGSDDVVEVELDPRGATTPARRLCRNCYDRIVEEAGISPVRVFKTGPRRTVVLPVEAPAAAGGPD